MIQNYLSPKPIERLTELLSPVFILRAALLVLIGCILLAANFSYLLQRLYATPAATEMMWMIPLVSAGFVLTWLFACLYLLLVYPVKESYAYPASSNHPLQVLLVALQYAFVFAVIKFALMLQSNPYLILSLLVLAAGPVSGLRWRLAFSVISLLNLLVFYRLQPAVELNYFVFIVTGQFMTFLLFKSLFEEFRQKTILNLSIAELNATQRLLKESVERDLRFAIARDLHDELGHWVTLLNVKLGTFLATSSDPFIEEAAQASARLGEQIRSVAASLRQAVDLNIKASLEILAVQVSRPKVLLEFHDFNGDCPAAQAETIFRACQESLTNCLRHSDATLMTITIQQKGDQIELEISDNGQHQSENLQQGYGLLGIRERVEKLNGDIKLWATSSGFHTSLKLPLNKNEI